MKTLVFLISLIIAASSCFASMIEYGQTGKSQQVQICIEHSLNDKVGVFAYSYLTENWQEAYAGLELNGKVGEVNYQIALGAGRETGGDRVGGWLWAGYEKFSVCYLAEDGFSDEWNKLVVKYSVSDKLAVGYVRKSFAGEGVYAELKLGKCLKLKYSGFDTPEIALNIAF